MRIYVLLLCVGVAFASQCGENSHFEQCGTACPLTCDNHDNPPKFCVLRCDAGCHCDEGYVKSSDGRCIRPEACPSRAQACGANSHYDECGTACPLTCRNHQNPPKVCVLSCNAGCHCDKGYVKSDDGRCVKPESCSSTCGPNSHFEACGTACPLTCRNYQNPPKACVDSCNIGCHCDEGYVKSDDGRCVKPETCSSKTCGKNAVYNECGTFCPLTCENYLEGEQPCIKMCNSGCECLDGYVKDNNGECVQPKNCPASEEQSCLVDPEPGMCRGAFPMWFYNVKTGKCDEFIYGGCGGNGNRYGSEDECLSRCGDMKERIWNTDVGVCALPAVTGPCRAYIPSYFYNQATGQCEKFIYGGCRGNGNRFSTKEECHNSCASQQTSHQCGANEHFEECGTACPLTCDNHQDPPRGCILVCNRGCHCDEGYVRNAQGACVVPENCASKQLASEVCALPTVTGPCKAYLVRYHFDQAAGECREFVYGGCGGNENNFRTKEECHDTCKAQKSHEHCPVNENYQECGTACPLTCDNYQNPPKVCVLSCNAGCFCNKGYVRNSQGVCVLPDSCPSFGQEWRPDCDKKGESGPCLAYIERFYYDQEEGMCKKFIYGGCGGNKNNFETEFDCYNKCGAL